MLKFEQYLEEFGNSVNLTNFLINLLVTTILAFLIALFYQRFGKSVSNRKKFAAIFLPLALTTMLIITIVKSSVALSLGLVGALSIVRFRAAIKEPEELTYLFMVIGLGLAAGANQPILAMVAISLILTILYVSTLFTRQSSAQAENQLFLNITTSEKNVELVAKAISTHTEFLELKRMDVLEDGLDLAFICRIDELSKLQQLKEDLSSKFPGSKLSFIDQPDLII